MIAIIPARGGSKELKNKNIKNFLGKPLIYYSIKLAKKNRNISKVFVLTDSEKIAKISEKFGAEIPFLRPKYLSNDTSRALDLYCYFLNKTKSKYKIKNFIVLQPTSPLRLDRHLNESIGLYKKYSPSSLISVVKNDFPIEWLKEIKHDGRYNIIKNKFKNNNKNRQDYKNFYKPNGSIYIFNSSKICF